MNTITEIFDDYMRLHSTGNERLDAIERVMDKRHSRMLARGISERVACDKIVLHLKGLQCKSPFNNRLNTFCEGLIAGYSEPI